MVKAAAVINVERSPSHRDSTLPRGFTAASSIMRCSMMWEIRRYTSTFLAVSARQRGEHSTGPTSKVSRCYQNYRTITERALGIAIAREVASSIVRVHLKDD